MTHETMELRLATRNTRVIFWRQWKKQYTQPKSKWQGDSTTPSDCAENAAKISTWRKHHPYYQRSTTRASSAPKRADKVFNKIQKKKKRAGGFGVNTGSARHFGVDGLRAPWNGGGFWAEPSVMKRRKYSNDERETQKKLLDSERHLGQSCHTKTFHC